MNKTKYKLLSKIKTPEDLRKLSVEQLPQLCKELRDDIIDELSVNPGHLASSLGVVEITVALHYVYKTPNDRIVWDVGHQAQNTHWPPRRSLHQPQTARHTTLPYTTGKRIRHLHMWTCLQFHLCRLRHGCRCPADSPKASCGGCHRRRGYERRFGI